MKTRRILVLAIRAIGDVVLITPILRLLKGQSGTQYLGVIVDGASAEVLHHNPYVDRLFIIDRLRVRQLPLTRRLREWGMLVSELRKDRFNTAVDLFSGPWSALLAFLSGATYRYGEDFRARGRGFLYNHPITILRDGKHLVEQKLELIHPLVSSVRNIDLEVFFTEHEVENAKMTLSHLGLRPPRLVGLIPSSGSVFRNWAVEKFAALGDRLVRELDAKILVLGGCNDRPVCQRVCMLMSSKAVDLSGKTTLREVMALFTELDLVISNVTGPMHLAVAVKKPKVIALYGVADTIQYAPWGSTGKMVTRGFPSEAYWKKVDYCGDFEYLNQITVDDVFNQVHAIMKDW